MAQRGLDHALRGHALALDQIPGQAARVNADADGHMVRLGAVHHATDVLLPLDVAGIDSQLVDAVFHRSQRQFMIKMNVCHQRHRGVIDQRAHRLRTFFIIDRNADDVRARLIQSLDLRQRCLRVARIGIGHGLHGDGCAAADLHLAHADFSALSS